MVSCNAGVGDAAGAGASGGASALAAGEPRLGYRICMQVVFSQPAVIVLTKFETAECLG